MLCRCAREFRFLGRNPAEVAHLPPQVLSTVIATQAPSLEHLTIAVPSGYMIGNNYAVLVSSLLPHGAGVQAAIDVSLS